MTYKTGRIAQSLFSSARKQSVRIFIASLCIALSAGIALCQQSGEVGDKTNGRPSSAASEQKKPLPRPNWMVEYLAGSPNLKSNGWVRISFVPQGTSVPSANLIVNISADQIMLLEYNARTEKVSDLLQGPRSGCGYARLMMPDLSKSQPEDVVAYAVAPGLVSRLSEKLVEKHMVRFVWNNAGTQESLNVKVKDCEYQSFIANIRWLLGTRWHQVAHEFTR